MNGFGKMLALGLVATCVATVLGQEKSVNPGINKSFENPDVAKYVKQFETEDREVFARRDAIVAALGLKPGMAVADIGGGTGLYSHLIAQRVGPRGKVFAVDIAQNFLDHITATARKRGEDQLTTVRSTAETVSLPPESIDLAFLCDTYHHFEFPAKILASIRRALRSGGELVVVDFDRREGVSKPFVLEHVRAGKDVFRGEIEAAGFELVEGGPKPALSENFFMRFNKKTQRAAEPAKPQP